MREKTIFLAAFALMLVFPLNAFCQNNSFENNMTSSLENKRIKPDYEKLLLVEYSISELNNQNLTDLIISQLMKENDVFFCFINVEENRLFVLRKDAKDINETFRGTSFQMIKSSVFEEKQFLHLYTAGGNSKKETTESELPVYITTGNSYKDDCNYAKAKEIFIKFNSDYYNKIK